MHEPTHNDGTQMYRLYNAEGVLLYVGISWSALNRITQHKVEKRWWTTVTRVEITTIPGDRAAAQAAERQAIQTEKPLHNFTHNRIQNAPKRAMRKPHVPKWTCQHCYEPATYIQYHYTHQEWSCVCKEHDPYPPGKDSCLYWIETSRAETHGQIIDWTYHLQQKEWFVRGRWDRMARMCLDIKPTARRMPILH